MNMTDILINTEDEEEEDSEEEKRREVDLYIIRWKVCQHSAHDDGTFGLGWNGQGQLVLYSREIGRAHV